MFAFALFFVSAVDLCICRILNLLHKFLLKVTAINYGRNSKEGRVKCYMLRTWHIWEFYPRGLPKFTHFPLKEQPHT